MFRKVRGVNNPKTNAVSIQTPYLYTSAKLFTKIPT